MTDKVYRKKDENIKMKQEKNSTCDCIYVRSNHFREIVFCVIEFNDFVANNGFLMIHF